jgi:hypothetical protein
MSIWVRPVIAPITQVWGNGATGPNGQGGHPGTDYGAVRGTPVAAAADGTVIWAAPAEGFGDHAVSIFHPDENVSTTYGHMEAHYVNVGDHVVHGQCIGLVDNEGYSFGDHLHFEVRPGSAPFGGNPPNIDSDLWLHRMGAYGGNPIVNPVPLTPHDRDVIRQLQAALLVHIDGGWGKQTDDAFQTLRWHCLAPPNPAKKNAQVLKIQSIFNFAQSARDGIWGGKTDYAYNLARYCYLNK